jgi:methionine-gamma-lyase
VHREVFAQTMALLEHLSRTAGIEITVVDARLAGNVDAAISDRTRLIYVETPSNPLLHVVDIAELGRIALRERCELVVDSTFASPILQQPLQLGATIVIHSGTKYIGGHSDVMCGFALASADRIRAIREMQVLLGTVADPEAAWLVLRSAATLPLRVVRAASTALTVAQFLLGSSKCELIRYPWLPNDPGYAVARSQMRGGGGVVSFEPKGGVRAARALLDNLKLIAIATSLGGAETVAELPYDLDFRDEEISRDRDRSPALVRLSVGLEDPRDLLDDLEDALARSSGAEPSAGGG